MIRKAKERETKDLSKSILADILENQEIAREGNIPLCQDTGVVVVFLEIGNEVQINGDIYEAINEGVRQGYKEGYLRKSMVNHPFDRSNTQDKTPAIIHTKIISGDKIKLKKKFNLNKRINSSAAFLRSAIFLSVMSSESKIWLYVSLIVSLTKLANCRESDLTSSSST